MGAPPPISSPPGGAPPGFGPPQAPPSGGFPAGPPTAPIPGPPMPGAPSPYGGMPPAGPPSGGDANRTPLFVVLGILGAAAVVLLIFLLSSGDDKKDPQDPRDPTDPTTQPPDTTSPPETDGPDDPDPDPPANEGPVKVVDEGFTNFVNDLDDQSGSFGFIVENTGEDVLQSVSMQVVVYGAGDKVITTKDYTIGTIRPGEKLGFGDEMYGEDLAEGIDRLEIQIPDHSDSVTDASEVPDGGFEVSELTTTPGDYNLVTNFTLASTYSTDDVSYPSTYVIYRDADGKIVGAAWGAASFEGGHQTAEVEVTTYDIIPDVETTEVYVDPGYIYVP